VTFSRTRRHISETSKISGDHYASTTPVTSTTRARYAEREKTPLGILYQRYHATILAYIRRQVAQVEDAEDVLLEVFVAALENDALTHLDVGQKLAWLRRVAHNKCIDLYRRKSHNTDVSLEKVAEIVSVDETLAPDQLAVRNEEHTLLRQQIAHLPELQQEILRLRFANGLRSAEIARLLNKSDGAIRMLLSRSLNLLRSLYTQQTGGDTHNEPKR